MIEHGLSTRQPCFIVKGNAMEESEVKVEIAGIVNMEYDNPTVLFRISEPNQQSIDIEITLDKKQVGDKVQTWIIAAKSILKRKLKGAIKSADNIPTV